MKAVKNSSIIRWVGLVSLASTVALAGCSTPEGDAKRFCDGHRGGDLMTAWEQLSAKDQGEIKQRDYANFEWDQETFDLRLLRSHESCSATVKPLSETEALATLTINTRMHEGTMSCTLPMVKEEGKWKMSRHWEPI
ncbi:hypothetical protein KAI87_17400, partial [Myxococcota bacterium]|nr:hypothetical protein [Myxococcota bacterium]